MSASPPPAASQPSQKRPLEEPSSPSGSGDQPEAKRPALGKQVKKEDSEAVQAESPATEKGVSVEAEPKAESKGENGTVKQNGSAIPSVASNTQETRAIVSTASAQELGEGVNGPGSQDESKWLHIRSIISSAEAATVIGKGGENVTLVRKMSGAKCTVSDYARGAVERILTVSGQVDAVAKAFGLISRTLNNEPLEDPSTPQSKTYPLRLLIPHILIGSIIGKGGVRIREIQDASGARLNASESCLALSTERSLVVLGVADAVHIATYYVGSTLVEQLNERFGGPAASAYATRSGQPAGVVPGGLQVVPYVPQASGGSWAHPDNYRRQNSQGQRTPANPYGMPYMQGTPQQHPQQQQPNMHGYNAGSPRAGSAPYNAGPHVPQQYGGHPQHGAPQAHMQAHPQAAHGHPQHAQHPGPQQPGMPPQQGGVGGVPGQAITQQIYIPNDMVGAIIGKGGQKINEIRQLSGSVIKINEPQDNSNERLVTITGTQECNQMALYMLYSRLESEKHRM